MSGSYDLKRSGEQYMFNLKAGNGQIILTGERYAAKPVRWMASNRSARILR